MIEEAMMDNLPLTQETFFNPNRVLAVKYVFPKLIAPESLNETGSAVKPDKINKCLASLTEETWKVMGDDPILKLLGREKFDSLPESKRLEILADAVSLLKANKEVEEFLKKNEV